MERVRNNPVPHNAQLSTFKKVCKPTAVISLALVAIGIAGIIISRVNPAGISNAAQLSTTILSSCVSFVGLTILGLGCKQQTNLVRPHVGRLPIEASNENPDEVNLLNELSRAVKEKRDAAIWSRIQYKLSHEYNFYRKATSNSLKSIEDLPEEDSFEFKYLCLYIQYCLLLKQDKYVSDFLYFDISYQNLPEHFRKLRNYFEESCLQDIVSDTLSAQPKHLEDDNENIIVKSFFDLNLIMFKSHKKSSITPSNVWIERLTKIFTLKSEEERCSTFYGLLHISMRFSLHDFQEQLLEIQNNYSLLESEKYSSKICSTETFCDWVHYETFWKYLLSSFKLDDLKAYLKSILHELLKNPLDNRGSRILNEAIHNLESPELLEVFFEWIEENKIHSEVDIDLHLIAKLNRIYAEAPCITFIFGKEVDNNSNVFEFKLPIIVAKIIFPRFGNDNIISVKLSAASANHLRRLFGFEAGDSTIWMQTSNEEWIELFNAAIQLGNQHLIEFLLQNFLFRSNQKESSSTYIAQRILENYSLIPKKQVANFFNKIIFHLLKRYEKKEHLPYCLTDLAILQQLRKLNPDYFKEINLHDLLRNPPDQTAFNFYQIFKIFDENATVSQTFRMFMEDKKAFIDSVALHFDIPPPALLQLYEEKYK